MSAIGKTALFKPEDFYPAGNLNPQANGFYTLTINGTTGEVLSVAPDGKQTTAPAGSAGPHELCGLNGYVLTYCPDGEHLYDFPYRANVPNV